MDAIIDLAALAEHALGTSVIWVVRRGEMSRAYGGGANDALPARGELGQRIRALVKRGGSNSHCPKRESARGQ